VWTCCTAAGGRWPEAVPAAAAVELFMVALDVLDDVEDAEETPLQAALGTARTLNVSTGLLFLARHALLGTVGAGAAMLLLEAGLHACNGQHTDLAPPSDEPLRLEDALAVAAGKAASLVAVACRLGSLCAGADIIIQERYARFGAAVGIRDDHEILGSGHEHAHTSTVCIGDEDAPDNFLW
jgi:competence protein ComQ